MSSSTDRPSDRDDLCVEGPAPKRPGFVRRLLTDTKGTATTETVIMIPMFAVVWGCIFFVFTFFQRTIEMRSLTRRDTWIHAYTACETTPSYAGEATGLACGQESNFGGDESMSGAGGFVSTLMSVIPGFTVRMTVGSRDASVTRPTILGGGSLQLRDRIWILRNEQPQGVMSMFWSLIGEYIGFDF